MKYVQGAILGCLILIAGLLFGIYRGQQEPPASAPVTESTQAATADSVPEEVAELSPAPAEQAPKPSPIRPHRPAAETRPAATPPPVAPAEPPAEPAPQAAEPEPLPPPVITPVVPNEPPLAEPEMPAPPPRAVILPTGTVLAVRLINTLSTKRNVAGDSFQASLEQPVIVDGWLVAGKGGSIEGRVIESREAGRVKGVAELSFELVRLTTTDGHTVEISTNTFTQSGELSRTEDAKKVGIGAGIGAIIGAIAGGGKGAAIGAGAGAGAGGGAVLATRGKTVVIPTETRLSFQLAQPVEVMAARPVNP